MTRFLPRIWSASLLVILGLLIVYPLFMLLIGAFTSVNPVSDPILLSDFSFNNFAQVASSRQMHEVVANTLIACLGGAALSVAIGVTFAWISVRTNTPFKAFVGAAGLLPLFIPPLIAGTAWSILGSPSVGLLNLLMKFAGLDLRLDIYSLGGLVFVFGIYYAPYVYVFTAAALRNMDPVLEEACEITGAGSMRIMFTITLPLVAPAILSSALLSFVIMIGLYGIPATLAEPANIQVLSTYLYRLVAFHPPLYNTAAAVAVILAVITSILVLMQQRLLSARSYVTIAGKGYRPRSLNLGVWRWVTFGLALLYLILVVGLPMLALGIAAFRRFLFIPTMSSLFDASQYSLVHFRYIWEDDQILRSIWNTVEIGVLTAVIGGAIGFAISYTTTRTTAPARRAIDLISFLPASVPGLIVGVAYLWAWIGLPISLYGTIWILALAYVARHIPDAAKAMTTSLLQIHRELEEAVWISGGTLLGGIRTVVLPLARPGVLAALSLLFVLAIRELGSSLFLYTTDTTVMAIKLLEYFQSGRLGPTAAFGVIQVLVLAVLISMTERFASRSASAVQ